MTTPATRTCVACGTGLPDAIPDGPPAGGVVFTAAGNYGSAVFDPDGSAFDDQAALEVVICDPCLSRPVPARLIRTDGTTTTWQPPTGG